MTTFRRLILFVATSLLLTTLPPNAFADDVPKKVLDYLQRAHLCASVDFYDLEVDSRKGIVENEDDREQVQKNDPLTFRDVDLRDRGRALKIKVRSPSTRGESISVSIILSASVSSPTGEFVNQDELGKALGYFTRPCEQESKP